MDVSSEDVSQCYCGATTKLNDSEDPILTCQKCNRQYHINLSISVCGVERVKIFMYILLDTDLEDKTFTCKGCLKSGKPSPLTGDVFFNLTCSNCSDDGEEEVERMKMQWTQVVLLALYNLQLSGHVGKFGYYKWKEHICAYIDKHWGTLFGSHRKKTTLWHGTVAGTLSSGCPHHFTSGAHELGETGWWRLTSVKPPFVRNVATTAPKVGRRKAQQPSPIDSSAKVEGLRSRRGKTSIESAMELKAKRETLLEAKEIRKAKHVPQSGTSLLIPQTMEDTKAFNTGTPTSILNFSQAVVNTPSTAILQSIKQEPGLHVYIKQEPGVTESTEAIDTSFSLSQSPNISGNHSFVSSSGSTSQRSFSLSESVRELDEDSQFSHASSTRTESWFTEQDLKPNANVPAMLMSDDQDSGSESDFEIDPGTITPPMGSPAPREESPTLQDILSSVSNTIQPGGEFLQRPESSLMEVDSTPHTNTLYLPLDKEQAGDTYSNDLQSSDLKEEASVVDSESDSESNQSDESQELETQTAKKQKLSKAPTEEVKKEEDSPKENFHLMSLYEERQLLKKLNMAAESCELPPDINRLRRKLIIRQLKRERGQSIFDIDVEMNRLAHKCWGTEWESEDVKDMNPRNLPTSRFMKGDVRILDRFQTSVSTCRAVMLLQPSFLNRLVGTEDDQLQSMCSPYTARILKPFIRRDYESRPLKLRLLQEIKAYPHRKDPNWKPSPMPPVDYSYVRPQHIPSVNILCREFFWPGIDLSECLQYPDFSCVVLFRKIVIGFAFMVPDVKYNEAYISFIFTHPEWRQAGIGTFMLYHLVQTCMGKDVTLHVSGTNPAMMLYQRFGFKPEEFILDFYDKYYSEDIKECKHAFFLRLRR